MRHRVLTWIAWIGGLGLSAWAMIRHLNPLRWDYSETLRAFEEMGVQSFSIVVVTALFVGAIMVVQSSLYIVQYGAEGLLGWGASFATLREVSPLLIGLMFNGRVGAKNTAELATMTITQQIDGLRALAIDVYDFLIMPKAVAMVLSMVLLVVVGDAMALMGGALTAYLLLNMSPYIFWGSLQEGIHFQDFWMGIEKAWGFGLIIAWISSHYGLRVRGGSVEVGQAVNDSVVISAISIFFVNYGVGLFSLYELH